MSFWLAKPVYELLPYGYMLAGLVLTCGSWWVNASGWSSLMLAVGLLLLLVGLVIWLRRRDYRTAQAEYDRRSLDD